MKKKYRIICVICFMSLMLLQACSSGVSFLDILKGEAVKNRLVRYSLQSGPDSVEYILDSKNTLCTLDGKPVSQINTKGLRLSGITDSGETIQLLDYKVPLLSELTLSYGINIIPVSTSEHSENEVNCSFAIFIYKRGQNTQLDLLPALSVNYATQNTINLSGFLTQNVSFLVPFSVQRTEITIEQWQAVYNWATDVQRGTAVYTFANTVIDQSYKTSPVTGISLRDARVWCNAASEMDGLTPVYKDSSGNILRSSRDGAYVDKAVIDDKASGYRMPVYYEYEFVCRGGLPSLYANTTEDLLYSSFGETKTWDYKWAGTDSQDVLSYYAVFDTDDTSAVASRLPNTLCLYDLCGNAAEWSDSNSGNKFAVLGGDCFSTDSECQISATPQYLDSSSVSPSIGLRVYSNIR